MNADSKKVGGDDCYLCGGIGEVAFVPVGAPDCEQDVFGCPGCIQAERDEAISQRDELQSQLSNERASLFAESQRKQQLEGQVAQLLAALEAHHAKSCGAGLDMSHALSQLQVSAYRETELCRITEQAIAAAKGE